MKQVILSLLLIFLYPISDRAGVEFFSEPEKKNDVSSTLDFNISGLSEEALKFGLQGFNNLKSQGKLLNTSILTIIDFSQSSNNKRMYVIDLEKKELLFNTYVAHGRNTGGEFAQKFSNNPGTYQSSLGFYITENMAVGSKVGLSLILKGIEKGFNDNARKREIIMHGADYATENFIQKHGRLGRSFGCPSLPPDLIKPVAETIKGGTCLFIYKNDKDYINSSSLLN